MLTVGKLSNVVFTLAENAEFSVFINRALRDAKMLCNVPF